MPKRALLSTLSLATLAACTTVGPDFARPAAPDQSGYAMTGDPAASAITSLGTADADAREWWKAFNAPKLDALVAQALKGNPTLQAADAALMRVEELERAQRGDSGPTANLAGNVARERINTASFGIDGFPSPTINVFSVGTSLKYDLDLFGGNRRSDENVAALTEAQRNRNDAAYLNLTGAVVSRAIET